jgi:hypothetical protein
MLTETPRLRRGREPAESAFTARSEIRERLAAMSDAQVEQAVSGTSSAAAISSAKPPVGSDRSQWERVVLTQGVELHFRRPLTMRRNKQVEQLLEEARRIMKDGGR